MIGYLRFKTDQQTADWLSGKLALSTAMLVLYMASYAFARWKKVLTVTEVFKGGMIDPAGTHHALRAVDIRNGNFSYDEAMELAEAVNKFAAYDPARPNTHCCLVYDINPDNPHNDHFHVASHPNTTFRGERHE
jgi:hypothetical protein